MRFLTLNRNITIAEFLPKILIEILIAISLGKSNRNQTRKLKNVEKSNRIAKCNAKTYKKLESRFRINSRERRGSKTA
jgi:hypothetical protein